MKFTKEVKTVIIDVDSLGLGGHYSICIDNISEHVRGFNGVLVEKDEDKFTFAVFNKNSKSSNIDDLMGFDWVFAEDFNTSGQTVEIKRLD